MNIIKDLISKFFKGQSRSIKAKKNIIGSFAIKGVSILIGFLMIRITLDYLDQEIYGVWLTLSSFVAWFSFFEIGLGNGLKNKLAKSLAEKDYEQGKIYVSTTYAILTIIIVAVSLLFLIVNLFLDWTVILNTDRSLYKELNVVSYIVFGFFFMQFVLKLISTILFADQRPAIAGLFGPIGNVVSVLIIFILTKTTEGSLVYLAWVLSLVPTLTLIVASFYFYHNSYHKIAPSIQYVKFEYAKELFNLGFKFFLIQISMIVLFQSSNIIIAQFYGPEEVTSFNIAFKYFSVIMMAFSIIMTPFWVAFTDAWVLEDMNWIKKSIKNLFLIWVGFVIISIILYFISDWFFSFWLGKEKMEHIIISNRLKIAMIFYFVLLTFGGIFNMFINGVGKISIQMYSLLIGALLFVPISYFFIKQLNWGIESVVIASIFANFYSPFVAPIQYYLLINKKANGIWNK